ncbi:MAG: hypothetical protein ACI4R6_03605 [Lachnospiraceae bacterium]
MVRGLDIFKKYFAGFENQYVLIGGAACDILFTSKEGQFRNLLQSYGLSNGELVEKLREVFVF